MAKAKKTDSELVSEHIQKLDKKTGEAVEYIRQVILGTSKEIAEHIKWNAPAFHYTGEMKPFDPKEYKRDIAVMNLHKGRILMVLPTGARIHDSTGLLEGDYKDGRRIITFADAADVKSKEKKLKTVIKAWLDTIDK